MGKGSSRVGAREELVALHGKVLAPWRIDPVAAAAIRRCVARIPEEVVAPPEVRRVAAELLDRLLRVAAVGIPRLVGAPRVIDRALAEALGVPEIGARRVYLALSALLGRTVLVERVSRQTWRIRLRDACDPTSEIHREMLIETPREVALAEASSGRPARGIGELEALRVDVEMLRQKLAEEQRLRVAAEEALRQARRGADEGPPGSVRSASDARSRENEDAAAWFASAPAARARGGKGREVDGSTADREGAGEARAEVASDAAAIAAMDHELMATLSRALITAIQEVDVASEESARPRPTEGARIGVALAETVAREGTIDVRRREVAEMHETPVVEEQLRPGGSEAAAQAEVDRAGASETPDKGPSQARRFSAMLHKNKRRR